MKLFNRKRKCRMGEYVLDRLDALERQVVDQETELLMHNIKQASDSRYVESPQDLVKRYDLHRYGEFKEETLGCAPKWARFINGDQYYYEPLDLRLQLTALTNELTPDTVVGGISLDRAEVRLEVLDTQGSPTPVGLSSNENAHYATRLVRAMSSTPEKFDRLIDINVAIENTQET